MNKSNALLRRAAWRVAQEFLETYPGEVMYETDYASVMFDQFRIDNPSVLARIDQWYVAIDTAMEQLPIVTDLHARYKHAYSFEECMDARMEDRLFEVDTMNDGCDSLIIADSGEEAMEIVAEFCTNGEEADPLAWANNRKWTYIG